MPIQQAQDPITMTAPYSFKNEIADAKSPLLHLGAEILEESVPRLPQVRQQQSVDTMSGIANVQLLQYYTATPEADKSSAGRRKV